MKKTIIAWGLGLGLAFSQDSLYVDIVLRDFPLGHSDFEAWDFNLGNAGECAEGSGNRTTSLATDENGVCFEGDRYLPCSEGGTPLEYGQDECMDSKALQGFTNGPDASIQSPCWRNRVYVTRGMVAPNLDYSDCSISELLDVRAKAYCARPVKAANLCHNSHFDEWYSKNGYEGKKIKDVLLFQKEANGNGFYNIRKNFNTRTDWNGYGDDYGFFPLDPYTQTNDTRTFGLQSLNVWCPDQQVLTYSITENCKKWQANGGPLDENAAVETARGLGIWNKLHNYGFTMAGVVPFEYKAGAGEEFQFIGDDDMWIFVDGKLVADLGGTHQPAPAMLSIDEIAARHTQAYGHNWSNGSTHVINFYHAERQTDGSNLMIRHNLSGILPNQFPIVAIRKDAFPHGGANSKMPNLSSDEVVGEVFRLDGKRVRAPMTQGRFLSIPR